MTYERKYRGYTEGFDEHLHKEPKRVVCWVVGLLHRDVLKDKGLVAPLGSFESLLDTVLDVFECCHVPMCGWDDLSSEEMAHSVSLSSEL